MKSGGKREARSIKSALLDNISLLFLIIDGSNGKVAGDEISLQKLAYFCQYLGWSLRDYRLRQYGPFSQTLAATITDVRSGGAISGDYGEPCSFQLTDYGREAMELFENACDRDKIDRTRRLVRRLSGWSPEELELAATIDYVANGSRMTKAGVLDKVGVIKPTYTKDKIAQAHSMWRRLVRDEELPIESVRW